MLIHRVQNARYKLMIYEFSRTFAVDPALFLTVTEQTYLDSISSPKRRNEYLQSRLMLKQILAEELGFTDLRFSFGTIGEGKPVLTGTPDFDFNVSHSKDLFAIVTSRTGQVGVDIEQIFSPNRMFEIAEKFFSENEKQKLRKAKNEPERLSIFARLWSGKEALIKAQGGGVFKHVLGVSLDPASGVIESLPLEYGDTQNWSLDFIEEVTGYMCCVAWKQPT